MGAIWERMKNDPAWVAEVIRLVVPALIVFGFLHWTDQQIAIVMTLVSFVLTGAIVRPAVTPNNKIEKVGLDPSKIATQAAAVDVATSARDAANKIGVVLLCLLAIASTACVRKIPPGTPPQVAVAVHGTAVVNSITEVEKFFLDGYRAGTIPARVSDPAMNAAGAALAAGRRLSTALKAYDAAVKLGDIQAKDLAGAQVQQFLAEVETAVTEIFGIQVPGNLTSSILRLAQKVSEAIGQVRGYFPKATAALVLAGAR